MSNDKIQSVLDEKRVFPPRPEFVKKARLDAKKLDALRDAAAKDHVGVWGDLARKNVAWQTPFTRTLDDSQAPNFKWFDDGKLNASANCLDRHLGARGDKIAIRFEGEKGDTRNWTYRELHAEVCKLANGLLSLGITKGDRVVIYMPMTPEAVIAMQACARIGAIHSVVFGGFSATSLKDRVEDTSAKLVIAADGGNRAGNIVDLKKATDEALAAGCKTVEKVIVYERTTHSISWDAKRDIWWHDLLAKQSYRCDPVGVEA